MPVVPPVAPMLARLARTLPVGDDVVYEPKWDGFRCLAFVGPDGVDLRSRHDRPFARYFPEVVAGLERLAPSVLDGELVVVGDGPADFAALMARLHPTASRVARLAAETPACFVAFDLLAAGDDDLLDAPYTERRARLEALLADPPPPVGLSPATTDVATARAWLAGSTATAIDGVIVRRAGDTYQPGRRVLVKVKLERTADCVVAGFRLFGTEPIVGSLLLALYDGDELRHVGVATSFTKAARRALMAELAPAAIPVEEHPWRHGFALEGGPMGRLRGAAGRWTPDMGLDWVPLPADRVAEVTYTQLDGIRFRHPARFCRWRDDRVASSCTVDQLVEAVPT